jgi:hypothetical protein
VCTAVKEAGDVQGRSMVSGAEPSGSCASSHHVLIPDFSKTRQERDPPPRTHAPYMVKVYVQWEWVVEQHLRPSWHVKLADLLLGSWGAATAAGLEVPNILPAPHSPNTICLFSASLH